VSSVFILQISKFTYYARLFFGLLPAMQ